MSYYVIEFVIIICLLFICGNIFGLKILSRSQWNYLERKIQSPDTTISMNEKICIILFQQHIPLVLSLTKQFIGFHRYKCKNVSKNDLLSYAYDSLYAACVKYKGNSNFVKYATIYINGALYKGLTIHYPINKLPKNERRKKYSDSEEMSIYQDIYDRRNIYLGNKDILHRNKDKNHYLSLPEYYDKCGIIWNKIDQLSPVEKRCFQLKFDYEFNKIRSNKHIAELMCYSEETIRKIIHNNIKRLIEENKN